MTPPPVQRPFTTRASPARTFPGFLSARAQALLFLLLLVPWLNPWVPGPSRYIGPWLVSAFCAVLIVLLRRHLSVRLVLASWWVAATANAAIGLVQYAGWAAWAAPWVNQIGPGEAFGNLRQRNQLATLTSMGLIALLAWLDTRPRQNQLPQQIPPWAWLSIGVLAAGNAATGSRTGLLAWGLALLLLAWWQPGRAAARVVLAAKAVLAYLAAALALAWHLADGGLFQRLSQAGSDSRRELWANVLTLIAQKPWGGWGWGELDYAHFITEFDGPRFPMLLGNAHNLPLHLAVELGIPAALLICGAALWLVWRNRPWAESNGSRQTAWAVLAMMGLHSLLEFPLWFGPFQIAVILCVGHLWGTRAAPPPLKSAGTARPLKRPLRAYLVNVGIAGSLALLAAASLDYHAVSQRYLPLAQRSPWQAGLGGWLFHPQAQFATLTSTPLTADNAPAMHALALELLHYSPEPIVIEKLITSAGLLGLSDELPFYAERYRRAFPEAHRVWLGAPSQ